MSANYKMNNFEWKLEKKGTIYNNKKCFEKVNLEQLNGFINTDMGIQLKDNMTYRTEQLQIMNYMKRYEGNNKFNIIHKMPKHGWGRIKANDHLTLSVFHRPTRHGLCKDNYIDMDMINCHSNIYLAFAKHHKLKYVALKQYCDDPKTIREDLINQHLPTLEGTKRKDIAKKLFISLANGGSYKQWKIDHNIIDNIIHPFVTEIENELNIITDHIFKHNMNIADDVEQYDSQHFKNKGDKGKKRTVVALWSQTVERYIQEDAIKYIVKNKYAPLESIIPAQDGLMMLKEHFQPKIIDEINKHIQLFFPFEIKFIVKLFDEAIHIPRHKELNFNLDEAIVQRDETNFFNIDVPFFEITQKKLDLDYDEFESSDIYIVQSGTGTGKSQLIAKHMSKYKKNNTKVKVLCLTNLITILDQLKVTFEDFDINLIDYDKATGDKIINNDSTMCVNSLLKLEGQDFSNTILYIDEPTNLFFGLTNNSTIKNIKGVMKVFYKLIKTCKKIVFTDAHLTDTIEHIIKMRKTNPDDIYYYYNDYKKFQGIPATEVVHEPTFMNILTEKAEKKEKFIFASDSKGTAIHYYMECKKHASEDEQKKFFLITADTKEIDITKLNYNNSYIFISPRVTCGVSIISKSDLDSFIHLSGNSINPITLYQQATRCRTMKQLYFFHGDQKSNSQKHYDNYEHCVTHHKNKLSNYEDLLSVSSSFNEEEELQINTEGFYFKLFTKKEYVNSVLFSDVKYYFN